MRCIVCAQPQDDLQSSEEVRLGDGALGPLVSRRQHLMGCLWVVIIPLCYHNTIAVVHYRTTVAVCHRETPAVAPLAFLPSLRRSHLVSPTPLSCMRAHLLPSKQSAFVVEGEVEPLVLRVLWPPPFCARCPLVQWHG